MKKPKVVFLIETLYAADKKRFESVIKNKKREQLHRLFRILCSEMKKDSISHERLFELLYKTPYEKNKNYLLRNELRLLSNELKFFMAHRHLEAQLKNDENVQTLFYLRELFEKTDTNFFLAECQKAVDVSIQNSDFSTASQALELYVKTFTQQKTPTYENYLHLLKQLETHEELASKAFLQQYIHIKKVKAFTLKSLNVMHPEKRPFELPSSVHFDFEDEKWNMPYFQYQLLWTKSYSVEGEPRIELLKKAEALIPEIQHQNFSKESELAKVKASIALDYFLSGNYELSLQYHESMLLQKAHISDKDFAVYLFNYISTLLRVEEYEQALQLISENEKLLLSQERLHDRFLNIKAMCLLLCSQIDEAETCIPQDRKEGGMYNYYYFRVVQSMIFYMRGNPDLSINELTNLQHSLHYHQLKDSGFKILTNYLQEFFKLQRDRKFISNYKSQIKKLATEIETLDDHLGKFQYLLPYKWLMREIT